MTDPQPLSAEERDAIAQVHVPDPVYGGKYCAACGPAYGRWPCDAAALLATVAALETERDALVDELRVTATNAADWERGMRRAESEYARAAPVLAPAKAMADAQARWRHLIGSVPDDLSQYNRDLEQYNRDVVTAWEMLEDAVAAWRARGGSEDGR